MNDGGKESVAILTTLHMEEENVGKYHCVHRDQVLTEGRQGERNAAEYSIDIHTLIYEHNTFVLLTKAKIMNTKGY